MKFIYKIFLLACLVLSNFARIYSQVRVIPYPSHVEIQEGTYNLGHVVPINCVDSALLNEAQFLKLRLSELGYQPNIRYKKYIAKGISLVLDANIQGEEAYQLIVNSKCIIVKGSSTAGIFYGIQTILQEINSGVIKYGKIEDAPRYRWRGFMLDEARHFFGKAKVKQLLDIMSYYKLNEFHWHLTDEQGWRIEIKGYPLLATIGGQGCWSNPSATAQYYTQKDICEIIEYAKHRHIEVIPEIDMPGHATAAVKAYPEYSGGGTKEHPNFTFNVGKDKTYIFLTKILKEIAVLFPSRYMHVGGDEVAYGSKAWETNSYVKKLLKREDLHTIKDVEKYFMHRMSDSIRSLGKIQIGWDELLDLHLDVRDVVIMWWRHDKPEYLKESLKQGYATILCPRKPLYFDFIQYKDHNWGRRWDGFCSMRDIYDFPDKWYAKWKISNIYLKNIIGMQANLWTELVHNSHRFDFMIFPRLCALAESAWTIPEIKNYDSFQLRINDAYALFDKLNIYYFDARNPKAHAEPLGPVKIK